MSIFKQFKRHEDRIINGARKEVGNDINGAPIVFLVARAHESNPPFQKAVQTLLEQNKTQLDNLYRTDTEAEGELRSKLVMDAFVGTCIRGWENVVDEDGTQLAFGEPALDKIAKLPELTELLFKFATTSANYVGTFDETTALKQ